MSVLSNTMVGRGSSGGATGVERSLRFRGASALTLTPGGAGNMKLLSRRMCVKRGKLGVLQVIASAGTASIDRFYFDDSDRLCLDVLGTTRLVTTRVFRDPTAWLIVGFDLDVANGTAANRARILVSEVEVASYSTDTRSAIANSNTNWNNTVAHFYGKDNAGNYFDGYMTQIAGVNGSNTITYTSTTGGIVYPLATPVATWGTLGHLLMTRDSSSTFTLGNDSSGNNVNYDSGTSFPFSLTGATYDSMYDYPVNAASGTQPVGNYATLNPLDKGSVVTLSDANLKAVVGASHQSVRATILPVDNVYWEATGDANALLGVMTLAGSTASWVGSDSNSKGYYGSTGAWYQNGVVGGTWAAYTATDVISFALDPVAGTCAVYKNGTLQGTWTGLSNVVPAVGRQGGTHTINFGQYPWDSRTATLRGTLTGYKSLCTANLPSDAVVTSGSFTGNASADGPVVYLKGNPTSLTINGNTVTFGTHADKLATGFKLRTTSASYNASGSNNFTAVAGDKFANNNRAQGNP